MEDAYIQLKKEFDSLRVSFTECRTELALSKCKSDEKIAELQRQVAELIESNADLVRRVNAVSPRKVAPPWDNKSKNEANSSPIESEKDVKKRNKVESAPWDTDLAVKPSLKEPWDQESVKDSRRAEKKSSDGPNEKKQPHTDAPKEATVSKTVSRGKDWNAICRELSSDDEEEEERVKASVLLNAEEEIRNSRGFIDGFIQLFNLYCGALEDCNFGQFSAMLIPFDALRNFESSAHPNMHGYAAICEALSSDVRRLAKRPIFCSGCDFTMSSFYLVLNHLTDNNHHDCRLGDLSMHHERFVKISELLCACFYQFVARPNELQRADREEIEMARRATNLALRHNDRSRHRPSHDFMASSLLEQVAGAEFLEELQTISAKHGKEKSVAKFIEVGACKQRICTKLREWFAIKTNKQHFAAEFEKHMKEGIPYCTMCAQAFDSPTIYYRHVTSYSHSRRDQSIFTLIMLAWKGDEYWDPMVALVED